MMAAIGGDTISLNSSGGSRRSALSREELSFETRQVVIDFLGIIPTSQSLSASSTSSGSGEKKKKLKKTDSSASDSADGGELNRSGDGQFWTKKLASLPEVSLVNKYEHLENGGSVLTPQASEDIPSHAEWHAETKEQLPVDLENVPEQRLSANAATINAEVDNNSDPEADLDMPEGYFTKQGLDCDDAVAQPAVRPNSIPISGDAHKYGQSGQGSKPAPLQKSPSKFKSPHRFQSFATHGRDSALQRQGAIDRQQSNISECSDTSLPQSECSSLMASLRSGYSCHSSVIDIGQVDTVDLGTLVKANQLPPLTIPLKEELDKMKENLIKEYEDKQPGGQSDTVPMTPQTEVAMMLSIIGDRVQEEYGSRLAAATNCAISEPNLSYDVIDHISSELVEALPDGWKKATLLLLFGQRLAFSLISKGSKLGSLIDNIAKVIETQTAEFIIQKGGWQSITALDDISPVSPSAITADMIPPEFDYDELDMGQATVALLELAANGDNQEASTDVNINSPHSSADSAIGPDFSQDSPAHTRIDLLESNRDYSLESISTLASSGLPTPADPRSLMHAGRCGGDNALDCDAVIGDEDDVLGVPPAPLSPEVDIPVPPHSGGGDAAGRGSTEPGSSHHVGEGGDADGPLSPEIACVQREIQMLRQISNRFPEERKTESENRWRTNMTLGFAGGILFAIAAYFFYKKIK